MNYFEIINKCLVELNYKECINFSDLVKNDHKKIKNIINIINSEICSFDNWNFLLRKSEIDFPQHNSEIENTIPGRIHAIYIDDKKFKYDCNFEKFYLNSQKSCTFSFFNNKILLPSFDSDKTINIIYYTNKFAKNNDAEDIIKLADETDESVIPYPFVEPLLVYGTCLRLKGNTDNKKFSYWYGMYKEALSNLRSKVGNSAFETPSVKIIRQ